MKSTVAPYETAAWCVRIECTNGTVIRMTDYVFDLTMSNGQIYKTDAGYSASSLSETNSLSPSALDVEGIIDIGGITRYQVASGVLDGASVYLFRVNYLAPVEDYEKCGRAFIGKTEIIDQKYRVEMMMLADALNESVSVQCTPLCRHAFGSTGYAECGVALGPLTVTGTITHVTDGTVFRDSARTEAIDWFGAGTLRMTSGDNVGMRAIEIKSYAADGTITLHDPLYFVPTIGDTYEMIPGCRKRRTEDCITKWDNILNFGGFPDLPPSSTYQSVGGN